MELASSVMLRTLYFILPTSVELASSVMLYTAVLYALATWRASSAWARAVGSTVGASVGYAVGMVDGALVGIEKKFKISINEKNIDHFSNLDLIFQYLSKDKDI